METQIPNYLHERAKLLSCKETEDIKDVLELINLPNYSFTECEYFDGAWKDLSTVPANEANTYIKISPYDVDDKGIRFFVHRFTVNRINYEVHFVKANMWKVINEVCGNRRETLYTYEELKLLIKDIYKLHINTILND